MKEIKNLKQLKSLPTREPFATFSIEFCHDLSQALFKEKSILSYPDLAALAFWLRKTNIFFLKKQFFLDKQTISAPRGLAFHIPPSNVDTIWIYSWILSLLVGNHNVVRLPTTHTASINTLQRTVNKLLSQKKYSSIKKGTLLISYGHEREITQIISGLSDIRIIWGGDQTISTIREIPLPPHATELVFPDRYSYAIFNAAEFLSASEKEKQHLANNFYNDLFAFDQGACASPRAIFWVGDAKTITKASTCFYLQLQAAINEKGFKISTGASILKKSFAFSRSIELDVECVPVQNNELTIIKLKHPEGNWRDSCGYGLLFHINLKRLTDLIKVIEQKDQTLIQYGFLKKDLQELVSIINGKGIDRIVPAGKALSFSHLWDGYDLLKQLVRHIVIEA